MRIRIFRGWASNNSGAYVLLGHFQSAELAERAAEALRKDGSLAADFAQSPTGEPVRCEVLGEQVLLEGYTPEMPPVFCAWLTQHGGRVQAELVHAHGPVVLRAQVWRRYDASEDRAQAQQAARAAEGALLEALEGDDVLKEAFAPRWERDTPRALHPIHDTHGGLVLVGAPRGALVEVTRVVRQHATALGLVVRFDVFEWPGGDRDPGAVIAKDASEHLVVKLVEVGPRPDAVRGVLLAAAKVSPTLVDAYFVTGAGRAHEVLRAPSGQARSVAHLLRQAGADATLHDEDGERLDG